MDLIDRYYDGGINVVDFFGDADGIRLVINRWVEGQTRQRICDLIPLGGLTELTRLVLVNAVYFKGAWLFPFMPDATVEQPFTRLGGSVVKAPLMDQKSHVHYMRGRGYQAVDLPYKGNTLSMLVLLPDDPDGLPNLEEQPRRECSMIVCRIRECATYSSFFRDSGSHGEPSTLVRSWSRWGSDVRSILCGRISGINGHPPGHPEALFISNLYHKAFVDVNEAGTEAAAASAMMIAGCALGGRPPEVPIFRAHHPFLFAIRVRRTGDLLFLGRVEDPTRS